MKDVEVLQARIQELETEKQQGMFNVVKIEKEVRVPPEDYLPVKQRLAFLEVEYEKFRDLINNSNSVAMRGIVVRFERKVRSDLEEIVGEFLLISPGREERRCMLGLIEFLQEAISELNKIVGD